METNALWALAALATFFVFFFSLEIYVPLWQFIRLSIFGNLSRCLLFLVMAVLATYGAYWALRGYARTETAPQSAVPETKELTRNGRDTSKGSRASKSRQAVGPKSTSRSEAPVQKPPR